MASFVGSIMSRSNQITMIAIACLLALGCNSPTDRSDRPDQPHQFLGIAEDEASNEGPIGLIGGQTIRVSNVSKVQEVPFSEYKRAIDHSRLLRRNNSMALFIGRSRKNEMSHLKTQPHGSLSWRDTSPELNDSELELSAVPIPYEPSDPLKSPVSQDFES